MCIMHVYEIEAGHRASADGVCMHARRHPERVKSVRARVTVQALNP